MCYPPIALLESLTHNDPALKAMGIMEEDTILAQMRKVKERLCVLVLSKRFDVFHEQYRKTAKSFMKFKWGRYNTVMSLLLKKEFMYHGVQDFAYLAEYFNSMMAPEAMQEGVFSVLKELLQRMGARMGIVDINLKLKIKRRFRKEFSAKSTAFLKRVCGKWLDTHRSPFCPRSKKKVSTAVDRILSDPKCIIDLEYASDGDEDEFDSDDAVWIGGMNE